MTINAAIFLGLLVSLAENQAFAQESTNAIRMKVPTETPQRPRGIPAIEVKPGRIPFATNDVTQYLQTHRLAKSIGDLSTIRVESLDFLPAREVRIRLQGESTGLPAGQRLGLAIFRGDFFFTGPRGSKPAHFERGYAVFDAATGNLLMSGTLKEAK